VDTFTRDPEAINFPHGDVVAHVICVWSRTSDSSQKKIVFVLSSSSSFSPVFFFFFFAVVFLESFRRHTDPPNGCANIKNEEECGRFRETSDDDNIALTPSRHSPLKPLAVSSFIVVVVAFRSSSFFCISACGKSVLTFVLTRKF